MIAIFVEPTGSLREILIECKTLIERQRPGEPLCSHPPHCTLLHGHYGESSAWLSRLAETISKHASFEIATTGWQVFANDPLTGGGQTLALHAKASASLYELQFAVADVLASFVFPTGERNPLSTREPYATSLRRYGYPYVGAHWIPHFTVASLMVCEDDPWFVALTSAPASHRFLVESISVWNVDGDRHERLHELRLALPCLRP